MYVIGNGESRLSINLSNLSDKLVGCNALHRDMQVDHLVCVDRRMVDEALENNYNQNCKIYTRQDWFDSHYLFKKNIRPVPDLPYAGSERADNAFHWGSGPYAVLLAAKLTNEVKMLGFDLYGINGKMNNVYKDTNNYSISNKRPIDPRYWIYQIGKVFEYYPEVKFTIYQEDGWQRPKLWKKSNVTVDKISKIYYNT